MKHPFPPVYNKESKILILGTFPSVTSREGEFYYHHNRNRFWRVISEVLEEEMPSTIEEKKNLLLRNHIALWDVIESCDIIGSSDASIKNVIPNDITFLLKEADIQRIYANGAAAFTLYQKYIYPMTGREIIKLPSTSPANAACDLSKLIESWSCIRQGSD